MGSPWPSQHGSDETDRSCEMQPSGETWPAGSHALRRAVELLGQAKELIAAYLVQGSSEAVGQDGATLRPMEKRLSTIETRLERLESSLTGRAESTPPSEDVAGLSAWEQTILGPDLAATPALAAERQALIEGLLRGEPEACALAGQLLVFQSAPAERLPQLLKEIGEAYYQWQPKTRPGTAPMEEALAGWLQHRCEQAGLANTIELVHPGQRFDVSRHHATSRGVEITAVHGWTILRDNGKVYMKATVSAK
jgi:hypothetical protein